LWDPLVIRFEPDLVESLLAVGQRREALWCSLILSVRAERSGSEWARGAVARCRGLLADEASFVTDFETALALQSTDHPFDRARTQLLLGERLRRIRRRVDAREPLAAALETFRQLGATPWIERATRELDATAPTVRPRSDPSLMDELTPQEDSVVRMILDGATIREAAGRLFLSPKTVEAHLGRVYRKLGVRNRAQLAMRFARA
jgi:DNA-binding CsgD family transcriptional regulator